MATHIVALAPENLFAFANEKVSVKKENIAPTTERFVVGKQYYLQDTDFEDKEDERDIYELVKEIKEVNGIAFNSLIMKPIRVKSTLVFGLNRRDCQTLDVDYQPNLQLFSPTLNWKPIINEVNEEEIDFNRDFDDDDLSTYPVDEMTKTVRRMVVRFTGFTQIDDNLIKTPTRTVIRKDEFLRNMYIVFKEDNEPFPNASKKSINGRVVTPIFAQEAIRRDWIVDNSTNSVFIELDMEYKDMSNNRTYGIDPRFLIGKNINNLITVSWTETEADSGDRMRNYYEALAKANRRMQEENRRKVEALEEAQRRLETLRGTRIPTRPIRRPAGFIPGYIYGRDSHPSAWNYVTNIG